MPSWIRSGDTLRREAQIPAKPAACGGSGVIARRFGRWWRSAILGGGLAGLAICPAAERLQQEPSAFLRASVDSPVDWMPWGSEAFARAKREQKPVFVAVGAFANELSAAMRRQTFARSETATMLNESFVCVLVDREEHPEVAAMFQAYVTEVKQGAGWPLNVWLTPELQPFEGAAYLPPSEEWGKPGFLKVAAQAKQAWVNDPAGCRSRAAEAVERLRNSVDPRPPAVAAVATVRAKLAAAAATWRERLDPTQGGFGDSPKNPEPELLRFLLTTRSPADRDAALLTLRQIAQSALHDPLDGGFFRNASDAGWNVPSLQKKLVDQARLALAYLEAAKITTEARETEAFRAAARGALDYALGRLARPDGTFAAVEDATAEEFAGYYPWTAAEIDGLLGDASAAFKTLHGVEPGGNVSSDADASGQFSGKNLLRYGASNERAPAERLRAARDRRLRPPIDERATAGAHGFVLAALARAGAQLKEERYVLAAERLFAVLQKDFMTVPLGDVRRFRGSAVAAAPADYLALAMGFREFAGTGKHPEAEAGAARMISRANELFLEEKTGRFYATVPNLPPGIFFRPMAVSEPFAVEALAVLASGNENDATVGRGRFGVLLTLAEDAVETVPGEVLLALAGLRETTPTK